MRIISNYNTVSSKGFSLKTITPKRGNVFEHGITETSSYVGHIIGQNSSAVEKVIIGANRLRMEFLRDLAKKYNIRNHNLLSSQKEDSDILLDIYKSIENPSPVHFNILERTKDGFENMKKIFGLAKDEKSLEFVQELQRSVLQNSSRQSETIIKLLKSKNREKYIVNLEKYQSYLKLYSEKDDAVEVLDMLVRTNRFDSKKYDSILATKKLMQNKKIKEMVGSVENYFSANYSEARGDFLKTLITKYLAHNKRLSELDKKTVVELYNSTNVQNLPLREGILNKFKYSPKNNSDGELLELKKLLLNIEKNSDIEKFVQKSIDRGLPVSSIKDLNTIILEIPLKEASHFFNNTKRIVALTSGKERAYALNHELENPFFEPKEKQIMQKTFRDNYGLGGKLQRIRKYLVNKFDIFVFNHFVDKTPAETKANSQITEIKFKNSLQDRKIKLAKEVNEIVKNKLGKRTYNEQEDIYRLKATKIRISMLPEIFASIKTTRAQDKSKSIIPTSSNKDAARLYELITGKNKKLVLYMLKQTDNKGQKIFDVKQIINFIENTNRTINQQKISNPKFNANSTKMYLEEEYNSLVNQYGKLKRTSRVTEA